MKNLITNLKKCVVAIAATALIVSCERDVSDQATEALFPNTPDVFTDDPVGLTDEFFESFDPNAGANPDGFNTTTDEAYDSRASIKISVPAPDDPNGGFIGGIFRDRGQGRNLTQYDALTFWAKGSTTATVGEVGFGVDFITSTYQATRSNIRLSTAWRKYVIPIPDASVLTQERGMFIFSAGSDSTGGLGYDFFIDEIKWEKLGTLAHPRPSILNGEDQEQQTFIGATFNINNLQQTYNTASGEDVTVNAAPAYFEFTSSNPGVATVDENGFVTIVGASPVDAVTMQPIPTVITATLGTDEQGNPRQAEGSLSIVSLGDFTLAPTPTRDASNVISIFSDAYVNVPVNHYNGYFEPFQTTLGQNDININGNEIIRYTELNFVATEFFNPTVNASEMTHFHVDIQVQDPNIATGDFIRLQIGDFGPDGAFGGGNDVSGSFTLRATDLSVGSWLSFDIPLVSFNGLTNQDNLAQIFFISDATISDILVDNMYFYKIPTSPSVAAPTPTDPAGNVISIFSDSYTDVPVDTFRTPWSSGATVLNEIDIAGNATKEYVNLGFAGIETVNNQVDASAMTHFRVDTWSSTYTNFYIKLVDAGPDGTVGTADDSEHEVIVPVTGDQSEWVTHDIPLSSFTGLTARSNIAQYIIKVDPFEGGDVYIDNMYFRN